MIKAHWNRDDILTIMLPVIRFLANAVNFHLLFNGVCHRFFYLLFYNFYTVGPVGLLPVMAIKLHH